MPISVSAYSVSWTDHWLEKHLAWEACDQKHCLLFVWMRKACGSQKIGFLEFGMNGLVLMKNMLFAHSLHWYHYLLGCYSKSAVWCWREAMRFLLSVIAGKWFLSFLQGQHAVLAASWMSRWDLRKCMLEVAIHLDTQEKTHSQVVIYLRNKYITDLVYNIYVPGFETIPCGGW